MSDEMKMPPDESETRSTPDARAAAQGASQETARGATSEKATSSRRDVIKAMALGAASLPVAGALGRRALPLAPSVDAVSADGDEVLSAAPHTGPRGTPSDPDLLHPKRDWPRKLSKSAATRRAG